MIRWLNAGGAAPPKGAPGRLRVLDADEISGAYSSLVWADLAANAAESNPFLESWYLLPSLDRFAQDGGPDILAYEVDGTLCGLMPFASASRYYGKPIPHFANWMHANMFLGTPLVRNDHAPGFWENVLAQADATAGTALFLHLNQMALDGQVFEGLRTVCEAQSRAHGIVDRIERPVLDTQMGTKEYRDSKISWKRRKEWRRLRRLLEDRGKVEFRWHDGADDLERWIADFLRIEASGWKGEANSALACNPDTKATFREAMRRGALHGALVRCELTLDGKPIAMLVNFRAANGRTTFGFKTAMDDAYRKYSPGVLLENAYLEILDEERRTWCDSCAAPDHPVMTKIWKGRRAVGRVSVAIGGSVRRTLFSPLLSLETRKVKAV